MTKGLARSSPKFASRLEAHILTLIARSGEPLQGIKYPRDRTRSLPSINLLNLKCNNVFIGGDMQLDTPLTLEEIEAALSKLAASAKSRHAPVEVTRQSRQFFDMRHHGSIWLATHQDVAESKLVSAVGSNIARAITLRNNDLLLTLSSKVDSWVVEQDGVQFGIDDNHIIFDGKPLGKIIRSGSKRELKDAVLDIKYPRNIVWAWLDKVYPDLAAKVPSGLDYLAAMQDFIAREQSYTAGKPLSLAYKERMKEYYGKHNR